LINIYNKKKSSTCASKHTKEEEAYHVGVYNKHMKRSSSSTTKHTKEDKDETYMVNGNNCQ
jgi:hypothetical protein